MRLLPLFKSTVLAVIFGHSVTAQETATQPDFPVGTSADAQIGQTYSIDKIDDWAVVCVKTNAEKDPCHIFQAITLQNGEPVAEINLYLLPPGELAVAGAEIVTPLGTLLTAQVVFAIDGGAPRNYAFGWCENYGCVARVGFTGPELDALKAGAAATLTIRALDNPNVPVNLRVSLKGFTAALNRALNQ